VNLGLKTPPPASRRGYRKRAKELVECERKVMPLPVVQRSVVLDEADRGVLEGLDVSGLSKAITGLAAQQLKDAWRRSRS